MKQISEKLSAYHENLKNLYEGFDEDNTTSADSNTSFSFASSESPVDSIERRKATIYDQEDEEPDLPTYVEVKSKGGDGVKGDEENGKGKGKEKGKGKGKKKKGKGKEKEKEGGGGKSGVIPPSYSEVVSTSHESSSKTSTERKHEKEKKSKLIYEESEEKDGGDAENTSNQFYTDIISIKD